MGPGVPGMGIASIFYLMAALFAPLREVVKSIRGESSTQRWKAVGLQFSIALGIISSIVMLYLGFDALVSRGVFGPPQATELPGDFPVWTYAARGGDRLDAGFVLGLLGSGTQGSVGFDR